MIAWSGVWDSDGNGKPGDWERYREVWQEYYDEIVDGIADMVELSRKIDERIKGSMSVRVKGEITFWMRTKRLARKIDTRVVESVAMALFNNQTLQEQIERLTRTVESVKQLSERKAQRGSNTYRPGATTSVDVDQTLRLQQFMRSLTRATGRLYEKRTEARESHHWALDLRLPDEHGNVKEWDCTSQVVIDFTFELHPPTPQSERRLRLAHARFQPNEEADEDGVDWQQVILGQVILPQITVSIQQPPVRKSRRFREPFKDGFFDHDLIRQAWEQDRARLCWPWLTGRCFSGTPTGPLISVATGSASFGRPSGPLPLRTHSPSGNTTTAATTRGNSETWDSCLPRSPWLRRYAHVLRENQSTRNGPDLRTRGSRQTGKIYRERWGASQNPCLFVTPSVSVSMNAPKWPESRSIRASCSDISSLYLSLSRNGVK